MLKVGFSESTMFKEGRPFGGSKIIFDDFTGDKTMKMGMDIVAKRKCPCPLWGLKIRANEGRGQTCLDYAKCSRIWRNSKKTLRVFLRGIKQ